MNRHLLQSNPDFRRFFASRVVSELGTWFAYIALTVAVYDETHSPIWVSVLLLLGLAPGMVFGFTMAPLLDRLDRKKVLVGAELAGAVAFVGAAATHSLVALLVFAGSAAVAAAAFKPGLSAALPTIVDDDELPAANALMRTAACLAILVGPPLAGILVATAGTSPVFMLNACSFAVSVILISRIPRERLQASRNLATGKRRLGAGFDLFAPPELRSVIASWTLSQFTWCVSNIGEVLIAREVFHAGDAGYGLLAGCSGAGLLVGSLGFGRLTDRFSTGTVYRCALLLAGLGIAIAASTHLFAIALAAVAVAAAGNSAAVSAASLTIQRAVDPARLGEAFGIFQSAYSTMATVAMIAAGPVIEAVGIRTTWTIGAGVALAAAGLAWALARARVEVGELEQLPV
jgi:predicted MFS family arabinose efflux permease